MTRPPLRLAVIVGIRAQFMKLAAFQQAVSRWNAVHEQQILAFYINSGQHYDHDLAGLFLEELGVRIDLNLTGSYPDVKPIRLFADMIVRLYEGIGSMDDAPQAVIVFGDANTTAAGAIAARRQRIPVVHIEAGVRTGNLESPEEANRLIADHLASVHFASSKVDLSNLLSEGLTTHTIWAGDLIGDLVMQLRPQITPGLPGYTAGEYVLASIHREENLCRPSLMCNVLNTLSKYSRPIVLITHPRTRGVLAAHGLDRLPNIEYLDALPYRAMLSAISGAAFLVTDSGAFQREAYYLRKRCLVLQEVPYWQILIDTGIHRAVTQEENNLHTGLQWIERTAKRGNYPFVEDLGNGNSGQVILEHLVELFG